MGYAVGIVRKTLLNIIQGRWFENKIKCRPKVARVLIFYKSYGFWVQGGVNFLDLYFGQL